MERNKLYRFVLLLSLAGFIWLFIHRINLTWIPAGCLFHTITGVPCPACGSTRAALTFLQGNYVEAFLINPLGLFTTLLAVCLPLWISIDLIFKKDSFYLFFQKAECFICKKGIASILILLVIANWLWNISKNL